MKKQTETSLKEIAQRIREMREIVGFSPAQLAERTEISEEQYRIYESGKVDLPFSFLHKCAQYARYGRHSHKGKGQNRPWIFDDNGKVKKGDKIGKVTYTTGKEELASFDIFAKNETEEINFGSVFNLLYNALIAL